MLNTFDALAVFPNDENAENNDPQQQTDTNAAVDVSAIINRLNEMETKINELMNKTTDFPTRGKTEENNTAPENGANSAPDNNGAEENRGE